MGRAGDTGPSFVDIRGESLVDCRSFAYKAAWIRTGCFPLWTCGSEEPAGKTCSLPGFHIMY